MLRLMREGYWREMCAVVVASVLLGSLVVAGVGGGVQSYFESSVESLVGAPGEYDAVVHLRQDVADQGIPALKDQLEAFAPGYLFKKGPTIAGSANLFIGLPDDRRSREVFESLQTVLQDVPGFNGLTFLVEPSVLVKDAEGAVRQKVLAEAAALPGVRFAFEHGRGVWVVTRSPGEIAGVRRRLQHVVQDMRIVEVRMPVAMGARGLSDAERSVTAGLQKALPDSRVSVLSSPADENQVVRDLTEVRTLLDKFSGPERTRLSRQLQQAAAAVESAAAAATESGPVGADTKELLDTFSQAADQMKILEARLQSVAEQLKGAASEGDAGDVLIAMLMQKVLGGLGGQPDVRAPQPAVDPQKLKEGIAALSRRLKELEKVDLSGLARSLRDLDAGLTPVDRETEQRMEQLIERVIESQGGQGSRLELLVSGEWREGPALAAVGQAVGSESQAFVRSAGRVEPDARTTLLQLLARARRVVAILIAALITLMFFFFDISTVVSFLRCRRLMDQPGAAGRIRSWLVGGVWTALLAGLMVWLGGGTGDLATLSWVGLAGLGVGLVLAIPAGRISPVDQEQYQAALSLGMTSADIFREVIVPAGRPGLLYVVNQRGRRMRLETAEQREKRSKEVSPSAAGI